MSVPNQETKYIWSISDQAKTGIRLVSLTNSNTGAVVSTPILNDNVEVRTLTGVVGANFSRLLLSTKELFERAMQLKRNPAEVLGKIINPKDYGHSSVAELIRTELYFRNLPDWLVTKVLNITSLYAAQQSSTRYIEGFSESQIISIFEKTELIATQQDSQELQTFDHYYKGLQEKAYKNCKKWIEVLEPRLAQVFKIKESNTDEVKTNKIRTLDITRVFLPFGIKTGFCLMLDTRVIAQLISLLKGSNNFETVSLGRQIEELVNPSNLSQKRVEEINYTPELAELIKYTSGEEASASCLAALKEYLDTIGMPKSILSNSKKAVEQKVTLIANQPPENMFLMKLIKEIYPSMSIESIFIRINNLTNEQKKDISQLVFQNFNHHRQLGQELGGSSYDLLLDISLGDMRDYNRHRVFTRFIPILGNHKDFSCFVDFGYIIPEYLNNPLLQDLREEFISDIEEYYVELRRLMEFSKNIEELPDNWIIDLLPMCHRVQFILSGNIKSIDYLASLRTGVGGRIDYRILAYMILEAVRSTDPLLESLGYGITKPDPFSREEYLGRS